MNDNTIVGDATYCKNISTNINDTNKRYNGNNEYNNVNNEHDNIYAPPSTTNAVNCIVDTYNKQNFAIREEMQNCTLPIRDSNMNTTNKKCDSGDDNIINYKTATTILQNALY